MNNEIAEEQAKRIKGLLAEIERLKSLPGVPVAIIEYTGYEPSNSIKWLNKGLGYMTPGTKLYTSQPAPVSVDAAKAFAKGFNTLETMDGKYKIVMQFAGRDDAWAAYSALSNMTSNRPSHANAPADSGTHPHNDGLDDYRGKV